MSTTFAADALQAVEQATLAILRKGDWLALPAWDRRVQIDMAFLRSIYDSLDRDRIKALVREKVEERIADSIFNSLATEVANDTKQIMCNRELREDVRGIVRQHIRAVVDATHKETT